MSTYNEFINFLHLQGAYGMSKWYERSGWYKHHPDHVKSFLESELEPIVCQRRDFTTADKTRIQGMVRAMNVNKKHYNPYVRNYSAAIKFIMEDNPHVDWKRVKRCFCENYMDSDTMNSLFETCQIHVCEYEIKTIRDALRVEYDAWKLRLQGND
uniref:Orf-114 protein n=1 Tax=Lymantria dispar multicapsid nuclear polyhedrosis virus TaxID=10449 RepID=A0A0D3QVR0_NPVLD|nr:orf-114 protein [Lymantria dispar multiple nucleopolyhedrovirus]AQQ80132.1 hypothetical protein [Lymantria dispar multiple nucleopolyhedrovirus]